MQLSVKDRQTLPDIALLALGSLAGIFSLAVRNDISVTATLADGQTIDYELDDVISDAVRSEYALRHISPATDIDRADYMELLYQTGTPRPAISGRLPLNPDAVIPDIIDQLIDAVKKGETIQPSSPYLLTRVFQDPFSEIFS